MLIGRGIKNIMKELDELDSKSDQHQLTGQELRRKKRPGGDVGPDLESGGD
jgi:hypothetical protein